MSSNNLCRWSPVDLLQFKLGRICTDLHVFLRHVAEPGEPQVGAVLVAARDAVHQVQQHLRVLLELLHLHRVAQDHVQVEHQVLHLNGNEKLVLEL